MTHVPDAATLIDYRDIRAVSKDQTEALRAELANSSFLVRMVWGRQYVHFAPSGQALFWDTRDRKTTTGTWTVLPATLGTDLVCWAKGGLPSDMTGMAPVDNCIIAASFIGMADYLSRGDVFGLTTGKAPK